MATYFGAPEALLPATELLARTLHVSSVSVAVDPRTLDRVFVVTTTEEPETPIVLRIDAMTVAHALVDLGRAVARSLH